MRNLFLTLAGLLAAEAAIACVCIGPLTPAQRQEMAQRIAANATAIAEVEQVPQLNPGHGPETYRVRKLFVGTAPLQFRLDRMTNEDGSVLTTSCDVVPPPGERTIVVLYQAPGSKGYRIGGTCDHIFINSDGAVDLVRAAAGARQERG